jgi:hypothetical protein
LKQVIEEIYANYLSVILKGYFDKDISKFILYKTNIFLTIEWQSKIGKLFMIYFARQIPKSIFFDKLQGILAELNFCGPKE